MLNNKYNVFLYKVQNSHDPPFVLDGLTFAQAKEKVEESNDYPRCCRLFISEVKKNEGTIMSELLVQYEPETAPLTKGTSGSAGYDLRCYNHLDYSHQWPLFLNKGDKPVTVSLGVRVAIPTGFFGLMVPRSGIGSHGLAITNTVGIIDSDYRGLLTASLINTQDEPIRLDIWDRILQLVILRHEYLPMITVDSMPLTERTGGYGSTGTN